MTRQGNGYDTYYIYDDHGRLCYVLPPMAVDGMYNTGNYPDSHTLLQQYAYLYKYDDRGNCIGKRLPGCKSIQMIYDRANRLVMSQDGNQQSESLWTITKYDALSRVLYTYEANPLRSPGDLRQYCKEKLFVEERADTTSQTFVRLTVLILVTLVAFSAVFDLDIVLGSFAAGFVLRYIIPEGNHTLETKLDGLAYGFLIPVFFTVSGAKINLTAVASRPGLLVGFIVALLIIRAVPILISMSICPATRDVSAYGRITVALYCTTALPIIVAVTSVAVNAGALSQDIASVMVAAGAITVFLMPLLAQLFYRVVDAAPVAAVAEVAEHPSDALDILRAHHDLASLLAREHELLTSHGHGRVFEGLPTLDTIAERLSAEAASGHIDARIVDAAHLLADKTYGDEVDPSELTPRERRRLERAKLAVREYRRRMLELYAREEAEDDDGK